MKNYLFKNQKVDLFKKKKRANLFTWWLVDMTGIDLDFFVQPFTHPTTSQTHGLKKRKEAWIIVSKNCQQRSNNPFCGRFHKSRSTNNN